MLHMNIQPDTIDLSLNLNQSYNVQGKNQNQGESSFSSMLEQAQEASSTDGNQTHNIEKTQDTKDLEKEKFEEKTSTEEINSQKNHFSEDKSANNLIDEKVFSISQLENLQNQVVNQNEKLLNPLETEAINEIVVKLDSFVKNVDLTKVADAKDLNVKNPKINSKIIEKEDLLSLIEDLKNGTKVL